MVAVLERIEVSGESASVRSPLFEVFNLREVDLGAPGDDDDWLK